MGGGEAALEEQPHRVAFVAEARLQALEDVPERGAQDEDRAAVAEHLAGRRAPLALDSRQVPFAANMVVHRDADMNVRVRAEAGGVAFQEPESQCVR